MSTDPKSRDWYNRQAEMYTAHVRSPGESIYHSLYEKPAMYALLPELKGKSVLSLGCGSGEDSHYLKKQGAERSLGIDLAKKLIEIAASTYSDCEFRVMDMEELDLSDGEFDFGYSSLAIHYLEDWSQVFSEVYRVLKPGGTFLFSCEHPINTAMRLTEDISLRNRELRVTTQKDDGTKEIVGDYLSRQKIVGGTDWPIVTWHKSIGEIVSESRSAGFLIENFVEPKPLEKMKELRPNVYERLMKIPEFMVFELVKPQ